MNSPITDKQQAAEDIISKALRHSLMVCNNCSPKPDGVIAYIQSAIKDHEARLSVAPPAAGPVLTKDLFLELINAGRDMESRDRIGNTYIPLNDYYQQILERSALAQQLFTREDMEKVLEWVRENDYNPRDKSGLANWIQTGSKVGWLRPGMSIIKTSKQVLYEYMETNYPTTIKQ